MDLLMVIWRSETFYIKKTHNAMAHLQGLIYVIALGIHLYHWTIEVLLLINDQLFNLWFITSKDIPWFYHRKQSQHR